jgi:hypothetical protein
MSRLFLVLLFVLQGVRIDAQAPRGTPPRGKGLRGKAHVDRVRGERRQALRIQTVSHRSNSSLTLQR